MSQIFGAVEADDHYIRDPLRELGQVGLKALSGYVQDEPLATLQGLKGIKVWREMSDSDPVVGSLLFIIRQQIRKIDINVEPADLPKGHPKAQVAEQMVDWVKGVLDDMQTPMTDVKAEASTMLEYGFAPMEFVLKYRHGRNGERPSKHDDGLLGVHKISLRAQETIDRWEMADNGDIKGLWQTPPNGATRFIPIEKLLLFRTTSVKNNPEGRSILRNAYRPWLMKKTIERVEGIGIERDIAGLPIVRLPMSLIKAHNEGDPNATKMFNSYVRMVTHVRRDQKEGIIMPSDWDEQGKGRLYEFELLASPSKRSTDTSGPIARYSQEIAQSALVDFVLLGHGARGTQALATTKVDVFLDSIQGYMDNIAQTLQRMIDVLWEVNNLDYDVMPRLCADNTRQVDPERLAQLITSLAGAGLPIFPDPVTEDWVRKRVGLPEPSPEAVAMRQAQQMLPLEEQAAGLEQRQLQQGLEQERFGMERERFGMERDRQQFDMQQGERKFGLEMMRTGRGWDNEDVDRQRSQQQEDGRYSMEMQERSQGLTSGMQPSFGRRPRFGQRVNFGRSSSFSFNKKFSLGRPHARM